MTDLITDEMLDAFALVARWDDLADRLVERYLGVAARVVMYLADDSLRERPERLGRWGEIARAVRAAT
ncbi:MAG: LLM class F420-dependent oxidoreductase, partial [Gammaproteobacteria bacterium]|nr:LLM class F420-dependent oxidoreductase [Gammaproteobacteria bacterium]